MIGKIVFKGVVYNILEVRKVEGEEELVYYLENNSTGEITHLEFTPTKEPGRP
jgi:hypothetical protein